MYRHNTMKKVDFAAFRVHFRLQKSKNKNAVFDCYLSKVHFNI